MLRIFLFVSALAALAALCSSFFGNLHPLGDSLAVFRGPIAIFGAIAVLVLVLQRRRMMAITAAGLVLWAGYTVLGPRLMPAGASDAPYSMYQKNMLFKMPSTDQLHQDITAQDPDFISLQEVSKRNFPLLAKLAQTHPSQNFCDFAAVGRVAVASKWPMTAGSAYCGKTGGMAAMQVKTPDGPVWVVSLHLHWPYPMGQAAQVKRLMSDLATLSGPVVLGGDFNMVPWSNTMRRITSATNTQRIGTPKLSFPLLGDLYRIPIDHILVNANSKLSDTSLRPQLGSDHYGVLGRFSIN